MLWDELGFEGPALLVPDRLTLAIDSSWLLGVKGLMKFLDDGFELVLVAPGQSFGLELCA